jgi:predicted ATPase/class 3 adenylate cyclase
MPDWPTPTGTVTLLFTDIEGSTKLWEAHPDTMRGTLARHDAIMRTAIESCEGYVFKTIGDAFCAAFATAAQAIAAMLSAQLALTAEPWPATTSIRVRMALHTGAVESRDRDFFGTPVNRVARLLGTAHGGQCILSLATFELVRDFLPDGVTLKDLGSHQLKDLARPEQAFQLVHPALPAEFPTLRSLSNQPNNLPHQLTSFIGREDEIQRVTALLDRSRLVTLVGSGGSGKTRLSLIIAADQLDLFPDGAWLIELATVNAPEMVPRSVSDVLGVAESHGSDLTRSLANHIGSRTTLLILDNCEHLVEGCARLADALLRACPRLKILVTSREALGISGESTFRVPALSLPDPKVSHTVTALRQFEAVRLFIDRAVQSYPGFAVTNENAPALASLCCRLDGIPLAVELAAARVRSLPVEQIDVRLDQRFRLLTGGSRAALPRQQTLRSLIDWSYDLLHPREKALLQRLSVFAGGWTLDAAEQVCPDDETETWEVTDMVLALVDKSLVVANEHQGYPRFGMLESIREYAKERLLESGEQVAYRDRHLRYCLSLSSEARPHLRGVEQKRWIERLELEMDNLRAALSWGAGTGDGLALAGDLWRFWFLRGHFAEGSDWLAAALSQNPDADPADRARALNGAGILAETQGRFDLALELQNQSLEISRSLGARWFVGMSLNNIGNIYGSQSRFELAAPKWEQSLAVWRELEAEGTLDDIRGLAATLDNLGNLASSRGKSQEALTLYEECLAMRRRQGNIAASAYSLTNIGRVNIDLENYPAARAAYREGLEISAELGHVRAIGYLLAGIARLVDPPIGVKLLGRFEGILEELQTPLASGDAPQYESTLSRLRGLLSPEAFASAWDEGREMPTTEAIQLALGGLAE